MRAPPYRFWICVMISLTGFIHAALRANVSISIIQMTTNKAHRIPVCAQDRRGNSTPTSSASRIREEFDWTDVQIGHVLSGYFYGQWISTLIGGILAELLGASHVILWSSVAAAALTGLTPLSTTGGFVGMTVCRMFIGILGGLSFIANNVLISKWVRKSERGTFVASFVVGQTLGTIASLGVVAQVTKAWGWPWGFYLGTIGTAVFCIVFFFFVSDTPKKSRWTPQEERDYIAAGQDGQISEKKILAPIFQMLCSVPFWSLSVAHFGHLWCLILILTYTPQHLSNTLDFDLAETGGMMTFPFISRLINSVLFGFLGDYLTKRNIMSVTNVRKLFIIFSHFLPACCFFLIVLAKCSAWAVIVLLVAALGFNGAAVAGHLVNPHDLAPNFAGTIYAMMSLVGLTSGIVVQYVAASLNAQYKEDLNAANHIYVIGGLVCLFSGFVFILFGIGTVQPWNDVVKMEERRKAEALEKSKSKPEPALPEEAEDHA